MFDIADYVNESAPTSRLGNLVNYLREEDLTAPIDMYKRSISNILQYATSDRLLEHDFLGRLLALGIVSSAEAYIRSMLSACVEICPMSQAISSKQTIHLGGVIWHGRDGFSRSAFEHHSFASKDDIASACKKYTGINLDDINFKSILEEYELVCQLRHGIVHSDGLLPGKNAVLLDIPRYKKPVRIVVRYQHIQDMAAVVNTLVATINRHVFAQMCKRWAIDWRNRADWNPSDEIGSFRMLWSIFHSKEENRSKRGRSKVTIKNCLLLIKSNYNL